MFSRNPQLLPKVSFSSTKLAAERKKRNRARIQRKDSATNVAWHSRADKATFMEHSFRRPLTPPAMGWKLKGASRAPLSSPAAAVRRQRFRIVLIIVRRPPRGGETVSRGWRPRPWPWRGSAGWRFIERQNFHCSPPTFPVLPFAFGRRHRHRRRRHPRKPVAPHSRNFLSDASHNVESSHPSPTPFPACTLPPLADYLKVSRLDGFLAIISFYYHR